MPAVATPTIQPVSMQGIMIPAALVDPEEFFRRTRRHVQQEKSFGFTLGSSTTDTVELRKADILSEIQIHITGSLVVTPGSGTVASTAQWPYGFVKAVRFAANGASNLVNAGGWTLRAREVAKDGGIDDRGVSQTVGGVTRTQGTLSLANESWGVGSMTSTLAGGTYPVDLTLTVPVAEDQYDLTGSIFLQTSTADLTLAIDWAQISDLFTLTGNGAVAFSGNVQVLTTKYNIPVIGEAIVTPDLNTFHSLIDSSTVALQNGENEVRLVGQGAGKSLLRIIYRHMNGTPSAPIPMTSANLGLQAWRYATNETPDQFVDGSHMRVQMERNYNSDLGGLFGFGVHEFAKAAFRDVVDLGTTAEIRLVTNIANSVTLTNQRLSYGLETLFFAGQGA